ncbi:hypothetical protein [uncultured Desulfovibrio sp.]|uniref:LPD3 domain-containing protein n=1 Tax=uncultured Desulfovibrio sp. TaxID=167968 RepID=UPI002638A8FA|nr:hypothetical protein [uncultured Desulfovibrio sp.]
MTRDYSAAIDAVFGPVEEAAPAPSFTLPADAANTSGGINAALDAMPGMVERGARERLTPAPAPLAPEFPWSNPTAAWYTPPEEKAAEGISTQMLRGQMAEREITRHALFPEGENDDGAGGLLRASFMLNNASRYSQDDIFTAATLSAANGMPFDLTLDSLDKARDMLTEFTPANVRDFAPGFLRLVQYDYDSAMLWRHDIPTANAIAGSFDFTPDEDSRAAALGRGLSGAGTMLLQVGVNLGRMGLEGLAALARGVDENYQPAALADRPMAAALLETSDTMLDWVRQLSERQKEISAESPLAGMKVWDNPEVLLDSRWWLENTPQAAASLLPMLGAYATGGKLAAGLMGLAMNGNEVYVDLLNAGMEDNTATRLWSLTGGVAMSALDVVGLTGILGGREAVRAAVKTALATAARGGLKDAAAYAGKGVVTGYLFEGGTEYAQNLVKAGIEAMARGKDFGGVVAAIGEAAIQLEDFILGGLMGGVIRGGHDVVQVRGERRRQALQASIAAAAKSEEVTEARAEVEAIVRDNAEAQRRMAFAQSLLQTAEAADSSALHQADPAIFEREAEKLMPEDARSVWLDVDMVREFAGEDNARLEALGLSPRDMADAVQIQAGSVRVPTVRLVSRFQGEDRILLLQSARMTPDGMTLTEARAFDPRKRSEAAAERIRARNRVNAEIGKERTRLKNEFAQAGYAAHVAEYYATMHAEQARAFADRYGSDAAQLLRERSIVRGNAEAAGQARPWQTAFDKSPDSFFSQGAMAADSSLPRRFAEMPGIEADSSQWFGEGKAIALPGKIETPEQRKALRGALKQWAKENFSRDTAVVNADTGWQVQVTPKGIEDSLSHGLDEPLARSVPFIPQIVESGIHVATTEKKAGLMSHIFANKIRLDGKDYAVGFVLREDRRGNRFYDHELTEIIDPDWLAPGRDTSEEALGHRTNRGDVMNILRDKLGVNDGSGRVMFQPDSDPASARGMVQFRADGSSVTSIFAGASDLSTPIHEGAHIFINDLIRVVAGGWRMAEQLFAREFTAVSNDASIDDSLRQRRQRALTQRWNKHKMGLWQAREDLAALVENANAQREAHGKAIGADLPPVTLEEVVQGTATPEQIRTLQEVNAVSFEGYVREGRAPSSRLAAVFHKMRQWLAAIYRLAGIHGVKVTPDVRRVFDRMLANDEAIRKSAAGTALAGEGEFLSIVRDEEAELVIDESGQWKRKDRINYAPGVVTQETTPGDSGGARSQLVNATAVGIRKPAEAGNGYRKAALNRQSEHERLQELYERAEAHVTARMDKATLRDRNKRWKAYYDEGREMARGDVYYEIVAALTVKEGNPWSGISRAWLEQQYGKAAVADFMKTAQGRRLLNKNGGQTLDAVGVGDIVGNMDRAVTMGIADADGLYNYLYDNVVTRRRSLADDARAWADQRMADDDARAEEAGNDPGEAYRAYLEEVEATVLRLAARQDAGWRTPEQQARWVEEQRTPLTQVRRQVKSILRGRPLKEILPNQFVGEVRKALQERNAALAAGNALDALAAVDRARTALESWIEANRIRKEQEDFERLAKRLSALKRDVVVPEAWTAIQDMLERFELAARRRAGDSPVTLGEAVAALCADSAEINGLPAIAEWLLNEKESGSYRNLTAEQLRDVSDALKMLEHMGREALAGNKASEAARVREVADAGMENMSGLAPVSVAREGTAWRKWQDWMRSYFGGMLSSIQWQLRQADGFSNLGPEGRRGISEERIYGAIVDGETRREVRMRGLVERMEPVFRRLAESARKWEAERGKALTGADGKPLPVPEIMRRGGKLNWTADRVIALAMNLGNEGNALRLREGYPDLTADTLAQLVGDDATRLVFPEWRGADNEGLLSARDWRDVQEVGNILQSQWKDIQATHERMFGFKPRGVEARPMTIRVKGESVSLNGWYYPAVYDPSLSPEVQKRQEQQDAIVRTEAVCAAPAAKRGFTRARANGGGGAPLLLETGVIMAHLNDVTRFIELAETVRFADRVTRSAQWRDAYIRAFGRQDYDAIRPNLKGIVLEERPATDAISKSADWLRERLVPWGLAFNFKTALLQSTAIFPAMNDLGAANVLRGVAAVARGRYALVRQIWEQSPYMKSRARNIDQDLRKTLRGVDARTRQKTLKLLGKEISWQDVVDAGMLPLVSVDMAASSAIWMAAYNREMAILANSRNVLPGIDPASEHHAAAVRAADMAVKAINPDFNPSSRSQFLRSRGAVRLLNIFSSAVVLFAQRRAYNAAARRQAIHAGGGGYRARLAAWGTYARYEAYDFALQGIAMGLVLSLAYGEDEPDKWAKNMGGAWLDAASMRVPVFNSMITGLITGDTWRGMSTVYQQPWDMAKRLRGAARTGEADKLTASMADVLSFLARVPASRVWRNAERGYEQWEKGEGTPASVLMPRPNSY